MVLRIEERLDIDLPAYLEWAYYGEGLTQEAIADELWISQSTVSIWMYQLDMPTFRKDRRAAFKRMREAKELE